VSPESENPASTDFDPARPLRDPGREAFVQELAAGEELYAAYEAAGFARPRGNANRMLREDDVAKRLDYLLARLAPLDEALIGYRRMEHRRALDRIANADRTALFVPMIGYTGKGKARRKVIRSFALKPFDQMTDDERALIDGLELTDKGGLKVHMPKRLDARALLAKLDGLDKPSKVAPTNPDGTGGAVLEVRWKDAPEPAEAA
jgi:hypothetical protein